jgi:hypothetical protein
MKARMELSNISRNEYEESPIVYNYVQYRIIKNDRKFLIKA